MGIVNGITGIGACYHRPDRLPRAVDASALLGHFLAVARVDMMGVLDRFLFRTVDPTVAGNRPITANPNLAKLNLGLTVAVDVLIGAVILLASLRSIFERLDAVEATTSR